jgi:hypothetical protein
VENLIQFHALKGMALLAAVTIAFAWDGRVCAQDTPHFPAQPPGVVSPQTGTAGNAGTPCVQPPPLLRLQDYDGPFNKTVGLFARKLDRKAVHPPHYQPGLKLCSLDLKDKFLLFARDTSDPVTFIVSGFNAGLDQARDRDHTFGQGAAGYGRRFGADFADQLSFTFFQDFAYPQIFSEDPRYYRLIQGSVGRRLLHALGHEFVAHSDHGQPMFNFSEWLGTTSAVVLSNTYHPGNRRGVAAAAQSVGYDIAIDAGFDALREFWPEISRRFRLPFREEHELGGQGL